MKEKVKNLNLDLKLKDNETKATVERYEGSLKFSMQANKNLKQDYDLLQNKLEGQMKISNTVNGELKEQIQRINDTVSKLQIFYDEQIEVMDAFKKKIDLETLT